MNRKDRTLQFLLYVFTFTALLAVMLFLMNPIGFILVLAMGAGSLAVLAVVNFICNLVEKYK